MNNKEKARFRTGVICSHLLWSILGAAGMCFRYFNGGVELHEVVIVISLLLADILATVWMCVVVWEFAKEDD